LARTIFKYDAEAVTLTISKASLAVVEEPFILEVASADTSPDVLAGDITITPGAPLDRPYPEANDCLFVAISDALSIPKELLWQTLSSNVAEADCMGFELTGWNTDHARVLADLLDLTIIVESDFASGSYGTGDTVIRLHHSSAGIGHFSFEKPASVHSHEPTPEQPTPESHCPITNGPELSIAQLVKSLGAHQFRGSVLAFKTAKLYDITLHNCVDKLLPNKKPFCRVNYLASDYKNNLTGKLLQDQKSLGADFAKKVDSIKDHIDRAPVQLISIMGYNGCGKTAPLVDFLKCNPSIMAQVKVATPENLLASQWIADIGLSDQDAFRVGSYESTCFKKTARILIVDEVGKMKKGYVDLCILMDPAIELVIVVGDVTQLSASETTKVDGKVQAKWVRLTSEASHFAQYADYYSLFTHRSCLAVAKRWGVKSTSKISGRISSGPKMATNACYSAMSQATVQDYASDLNCQTHASTQGATFEKIHDIAIDFNFAKFADKYMVNMLTNRSRIGIHFSGTLDKKLKALIGHNTVLANFLAGRVQPIEQLFATDLQGLEIIRSPLTYEQRFQGGC
jgi:hypothetical protein